MAGGSAQTRSNGRLGVAIAGGLAALAAVGLLFAPVAGGASTADDTFTEVSGSPNPSAAGQVVTIVGRECNRSRTVQATGVIAFTDLTTGKSLGSNKLGSAPSPYSNCGDTTIDVALPAGDHTIQAQYDPSGPVPVTPSKPATYMQTVAAARDPKLSVDKAGSGKGTVTSRPAGIDCGSICSATFPQVSRLALIASPDPSSTFRSWSEPSCDGAICYVTLDRDKSVTATFVATNATLSVAKTGSGTVTSTPAGIACGSTCSAQYKTGTTVALDPVADQGWKFVSWGGACSGNGACTVSLDSDKSVAATFALVAVAPQPRTLTVTRQGSGSGSVTSDLPGINCGSTCSASYAPGTKVNLSASESDNSTFSGWGGACSGTGACSVTVQGDVSVTATFAPKNPTQSVPTQPPPTDQAKKPPVAELPQIGDSSQTEPPPALTVDTANPADVKAVAELAAGVTGNGTIEQELVRGTQAAQATGIRCGFNEFRCYTRLEPGQHVVLRARPLADYVFRAWTGACAGQGPRCVVIAEALRTVTALFTPRNAVANVGFDVNQISVRVKWLQSVGSGKIIVSGRVGGVAALRAQVRRPGGGPLLTRRFAVAGGSFRQVIPLRKDVLPRGAKILPGGFVVSVVGRSGASSLPFQLRPIVVPAPPEGVLRQGFVTTIEDGPATVRLPAGTAEAWVHFRLATQPANRLPVSVAWYWPDGRPLGTVAKANRPEIVSFLRLDSGLPSGAWIAELRAGNRIVKRLTVRIG